MSVQARSAFPTESRPVAGATDGGYRAHIITHCSRCDVEGALPVSKHSGTVPAEAGQKIFRNAGWRMGASRAKDLCPLCNSTAKRNSAPVSERFWLREELVYELIAAGDSDPAYLKQVHMKAVFRRYPALVEAVDAIREEWSQQGEQDMSNTAIHDALIKAGVEKIRRDKTLPDKDMADLDLMLEDSEELVAMAIENRKEMPIAEVVEPVKVTRVETPAKPKPATVKPVTLNAEGRTPAQQAELDAMIAAQDRLANQGVSLRGAKRKAPLPPIRSKAEEKTIMAAKVTPVVEPVVTPEPATAAPVKLSKSEQVKQVWANYTPEQREAHAAGIRLRHDKQSAAKHGITLEEAISRREAKQAREAERAAQKAAKQDAPDLFTPAAPEPTPTEATPTIPETVMTATPAAPAPPRAWTSDERKKVRALLDEHYDEDAGRYRGSHSDRKLADTNNLPAALFAELRSAMGLGEDVNESASLQIKAAQEAQRELAALAAALDKGLSDNDKEVDTIMARAKQQIDAIGVNCRAELAQTNERRLALLADIDSKKNVAARVLEGMKR